MTMLTEEEFATHVNGYCQCGCTEPLIEHDRAQRNEIERLNDIIRRAAWLEQAPEEGSPYIDFESYARATEESEALRTRAEEAEAERYDLYSELALAKAKLGEIVELCGDGGDGTAFGCVESLVADLAEQTARAEKAEAERDRLLALAARKSCAYCGYITPEGLSRERTMQEISGHVTTCPKNVFRLVLQELEAELAAQIKAAEDDCHRWDEMERKLNRYLAAMREWVDDGSAPRAIRAIVEEEARRG